MDRRMSEYLRVFLRLRAIWGRRGVLPVILLSLICVKAGAFESDGFTFEILNDGSVSITDCTVDNVDDFTIPAAVTYSGKTYKVTQIGEMAFARKNYKTVVVPEGIEGIEDNAFLLNSVSDVRLPQSLTRLGSYAFSRCDLKSINLPPNIGVQPAIQLMHAGGDDETIEDVTIEGADTEAPWYLDVKCNTLRVGRQWSGTCHGVTNELTFEGADLIVDIYCLRYFDILPAVINFKGGDITLINSYHTYEPTGELQDNAYWKTSIIDQACYGIDKGNGLNKLDCMATMTHQVRNVNISCNRFTGGARTFSNLKSLPSFSANASEIDVQRSTFANCDELTAVDLTPFTGLEDGMFQNCVKLPELVITPGCTHINGMAFLGCSALKKIEIAPDDTPVVIGCGAFKKIPLEELTLRRGFVAGDTPFYNIGTLSRLTLGENVTELPDYAFAGCTGLREIYCESPTPPAIHQNTFKGVSRSECKVYVYDNEQGYKETDGWKEFFSGVETVTAAPGAITVTSAGSELVIKGVSTGRISIYDYSGNEIVRQAAAAPEGTAFTLPAGHYIVVGGNHATKHFHN